MHKPGQGYWTRMGTALGAGIFLLFTGFFLYRDLLDLFGLTRSTHKLIVIGSIVALGSLLTWWLMNGPKRADFLIDTDSEMKKVNWASRRELIVSTLVVIFFMIVIALALFIFDNQFHAFFHLISIYRIPVQPIAVTATGLLLCSVMAYVGYLIRKGADDKTPRMWGGVMLAVGVIGFLAWAGSIVWGMMQSAAAA
jgi:preprotein translocase subunit SecE